MPFFIITLVSSQAPLTPGHLALIEGLLEQNGITLSGPPVWLDPHKAADLPVAARPRPDHIRTLRLALENDKIDVLVTPSENRRKKLLLADMDSTIVEEETLDELAVFLEPPSRSLIEDMTLRTMRGEMDFEQSLRERIKLFKGVGEKEIESIRAATTLMPGAREFVGTMRHNGATCVLVTGGFSCFSAAVAERVGFNRHHENQLERDENGAITGGLVGPVLDKNAKRAYLLQYREELGLAPADVLAIGDGSNDLAMLEESGLGIGFHPKPLLRERLDNCILYGDLTAALYAQGYRKDEMTTWPKN